MRILDWKPFQVAGRLACLVVLGMGVASGFAAPAEAAPVQAALNATTQVNAADLPTAAKCGNIQFCSKEDRVPPACSSFLGNDKKTPVPGPSKFCSLKSGGVAEKSGVIPGDSGAITYVWTGPGSEPKIPTAGTAPGLVEDGQAAVAAAAANAAAAAAAAEAAASGWDGKGTVEGLPAWRWGWPSLDSDTEITLTGGLNMQEQVFAGIAGILFACAYFLWQLLLTLMRFALSGDIFLEAAAGPINFAVAWLGSNVIALSILFWAVALFRLGKDLITLKWVKMLRTLLVFVLGFGVLLVVVQASDAANTARTAATREGKDKPSVKDEVGTMPWAASTATSMVNTLLSPITTPVLGSKDERWAPTGVTPDPSTGAQDVGDAYDPGNGSDKEQGVSAVEPKPDEQQAVPATESEDANTPKGAKPTCGQYINTLESGYLAGPEANRALVIVNRFWLETYYKSWQTAAFGVPTGPQNLPDKAMCHWAEATTRISASDQQAIMQAAYPGIAIADGAAVYGPDYESLDGRRVAMTAWASCVWDPDTKKWTTDPLYNETTPYETPRTDKPDACGVLFDQTAAGTLRSDSEEGKWFWIYGDDVVKNTAEMTNEDERDAVGAFGRAMSGYDGVQRMVQGLIALITAVLFLYSMGAIAIGLAFTQLLAILCLMVVAPAAFVLFAVGQGKKSSQLMRLTASTVLSQVLFTLLLTALVLVTGLISALFASVSLPGVTGPMLIGLSPVIAYLLIRKAMKMFGLGDVMTGGGALTFATSAALVATQDRQLGKLGRGYGGRANDVQKGLSRVPFLGRGVNAADKLTRNALPAAARRADPRLAARMRREDERKKQEELRAKQAKETTDAKSKRDKFLDREIARRTKADGTTGGLASALNKLDGALKTGSPERERARKLAELALQVGLNATVAAAGMLDAPNLAMLGALSAALPKWAAERGLNADSLFAKLSMLDAFSSLSGGTVASDWAESARKPSQTEVDGLPDVGYDPAKNPLSMEDRQTAHNDAFQMSINDPEDGPQAFADQVISDGQMATFGAAGMAFTASQLRAVQVAAAAHFGFSGDDATGRVLVSSDGIARVQPITSDQMNGTPKGGPRAAEMERFENWISNKDFDDLLRKVKATEPGDAAVILQYLGSRAGVTDGNLSDALGHKSADEFYNPKNQEAFIKFRAGGDLGDLADIGGIRDLLGKLTLSELTSHDERVMQALVASTRAGSDSQHAESAKLVAAAVAESKASTETAGQETVVTETTIRETARQAEECAKAEADVAAARESGDVAAMDTAAARFVASMDRFDVVVESALNNLVTTMGKHAEISAAAAGLSTGSNDDFLRAYGEHLESMDRTSERFADAATEFKSGVGGLKETVAKFDSIADQITNSYQGAQAELNTSIERAAATLSSSTVRRSGSKPTEYPTGSKFAEGTEPLP